MFSLNKIAVIFAVVKFSVSAAEQDVTKIESKFRILAPEFICPKDENAVIEKPDDTVITLQTAADADMRLEWTVRWRPVDPTPAQRFTLLLWRTVRELEKQLNRPQPEPYVYVINNSELLPGVNYVFNISSIEPNGEVSEPRSFNIDNTQGDRKLMIEGRNDMLSVLLIGSQATFVDAAFVVEAEITTCHPTQDYYFAWSVQSLESKDTVDLSYVQGSRLQVPPCTLKAGVTYNVNCQVIQYYNGHLITQSRLPFLVQYRGLEVYLSVDYLVISRDEPFTIESLVISHDYCETFITYEWDCTHNGESCNSRLDMGNETIIFPSGFTDLGEYFITMTVRVSNQTSTANATIEVVSPVLPVIQLEPIPRILNAGSVVSVVANATNLVPTCTLTWYLATEEYIAALNTVTSNETCDDCEHGEALSETMTIYSLEEQFLSELADFSNETEWRQVIATFPATAVRARFVAKCGCSLTFSCDAQGLVHADIWFQLNERPMVGEVTISPESGTALETVFRFSTRAAVDKDSPLQYSFYCSANNDTILLASYTEHRAAETFLPYIAGGIDVFVEVCDTLGACSRSQLLTVTIAPGEGRTVDSMIEDAMAHARRCEMAKFIQIVQSAIITYRNAHQSDPLTKFRQSLEESLKQIDKYCISKHYEQHSGLLLWLTNYVVETNSL